MMELEATEMPVANRETPIVTQENEAWIRSIFGMVPTNVYFGGAASEFQRLLKKEQAEGKKKEAEGRKQQRQDKSKKRKATEIIDEDSDEDSDIGAHDKERMEKKKKLREKIDVMRAGRNVDDREKSGKNDSDERKSEKLTRKQKRTAEEEAKKKKGQRAKRAEISKKRRVVDKSDIKVSEESGKHNDEITNSGDNNIGIAVETARMTGFAEDVDEQENDKGKKKKRKLGASKLKELQNNLNDAMKERELKAQSVTLGQKAEEKAKRKRKINGTEGNGGDETVATAVVEEREMEKALMRVRGEKVKDNVAKLKKSIRKEKRSGEKSREEWAKRVEAVEEDVKARQEKKQENLKKRREEKKSGGKGKGKGKGKGAKGSSGGKFKKYSKKK